MRNFFFIGVTTGASAMQKVFPLWAGVLKRDLVLLGIDLPVGAPPEAYRRAMLRILEDNESYGALVTTHKFAIVEHAGDLIAEFSPEAKLLGEAGALIRRGGAVRAEALDVECSIASLVKVADPAGRDVLILGAGGAGTALALGLRGHGARTVYATDVSERRLEKIAGFGVVTSRVDGAEGNDAVLARMRPGTIVVNATGLGKDLPGSPVTAAARFPEQAIAWELNYRGDLKFLEYARAAGVRTADGWDHFVFSWSMVMSRVIGFDLTPAILEEFGRIAARVR